MHPGRPKIRHTAECCVPAFAGMGCEANGRRIGLCGMRYHECIHPPSQPRPGVNYRVGVQVNVNGHESDPLFAWLKAASGNPVDIPWNFSKFLVVCGDTVMRYSHEVRKGSID